MKDLMESFRAARTVGTPLIAVSTADEPATLQLMKNGNEGIPRYMWDSLEGLRPINKAGEILLAKVGMSVPGMDSKQKHPFDGTYEIDKALQIMLALPDIEVVPGGIGGSIVFMSMMDNWYNEKLVKQGLMNLREPYKGSGRTVVMFGVSHTLPAELQTSVLTLEQPLPDNTRLGNIIDDSFKEAGVTLEEPVRNKAIDAVSGLSEFSADQAVAMSYRIENKKIVGLDIDELWRRKETLVNQTPGLSFSRGKETFDDLGGLETLKKYCQRLFGGKKPPRCIVRVDEIEKVMSGSEGDMSGVAQDQLKVLLTSMQDYEWSGIIAVGFPGTGKSAISKAMGNYGDVPTLEMDLGAMLGSLMGESQQSVRLAINVIHAIAGNNAFFVGTCNDASTLRPELLRRFSEGTWMFDLPSAEQRASIWQLYAKKFNLMTEQTAVIPDDIDWTGAEIRSCSQRAYNFDISLTDAAKYVIPFAQSNGELVERLREASHARCLSADHDGYYVKPEVVKPGGYDKAVNSRRFSPE